MLRKIKMKRRNTEPSINQDLEKGICMGEKFNSSSHDRSEDRD